MSSIAFFTWMALTALSLPLFSQNDQDFRSANLNVERILEYHTDIEVNKDRSVTVTETLKVNVLGYVIKRGITRSFPGSRYLNDRTVPMSYKNLEVFRDGKKEPFKREEGVLYIGSADVFLQPGVYTYTIKYRCPDQIGFYENYDEIYWNAIGVEVQFPIDRASCTVTLPEGVEVVQQAAYLGYEGSTDQAFEFRQDGQRLEYRATRGLNPYEGFTVAVGFEKGHMEQPGWFDRFASGILLLLMSIFLLPYYLITWMRHGQDPPSPPVVPDWHSPDGLSAASINYIKNGMYQTRSFTASIVDLAIKGHLKIQEEESKILFFKTKTYKLVNLSKSSEQLPEEEKMLLGRLFRSGDVIEIDGKYDPTMEKAFNVHKNSVSNQHRSFIWKGHNSRLLVVPILFTAFSVIAAIVFYANSAYADPANLTAILSFVPLSILALVLYGWLIRKPSVEKLDLRSRIKGFQMYLEMAEADRLRLLNPPDMTPEHFEKMLPYAFALGVEHEWTDKFKTILDKMQYRPQWTNSPNPVYFSDHFGRNFAQSVSGAATKPSKSGSGSGGGGFSGGGGGGGGVGGW